MATFFSFGGGRQSTAIALLLIHEPEKLAATGLELPEHIIFADTGAEPKAVIFHVREMEKLLTCAGYQFHWVYKDGKEFVPIDEDPNGVPFYFKGERGETSMLKRQCTNNYKVQPVQKKIKELLGVGKGQRVKGLHDLWLGISLDEAQRATNNSEKWLNKQYPLIQWHGLLRTA